MSESPESIFAKATVVSFFFLVIAIAVGLAVKVVQLVFSLNC